MSKRSYKQLKDADDQPRVERSISSMRRQSSGSIAMESFPRTNPLFDNDVERDGMSAESFMVDYVEITYDDVNEGIQAEFQQLLIKESGIKRMCIHKGLFSSLLFLIILVTGIVFVEINFDNEGFTSMINEFKSNTSSCEKRLSLCFGVRAIRSIGLFGFFGGLFNWVFIILLFQKIPCLIGTGVFQKHHREVIDGLRHIVIEVLFDEEKLKEYVSGTSKNIKKALQLNQHFQALLESSATEKIIDGKIDKFLTSPQGILLAKMGSNEVETRKTIKHQVKSLINKLSKLIHERLRIPGITDGGLKTEITRILEPRLEQMQPSDINKMIILMIRKHLSWLIIWGNVFGALLGLVNEIIVITIVKLS